MRISDWSSDVCSSDLSGVADDGTFWLAMPLVDGERIDRWCEAKAPDAHAIVRLYLQVCGAVAYAHRNLVIHRDIKRSEEHTSEIQSLMRISYAVFCLKKKNQYKTI